jgi:hypothetical protein
MCDDSNPLSVVGNDDAAPEQEQPHTAGCKNPNCPNRHRCAAASKLNEEALKPSSSPPSND